jgi:hypothetical protein
LILHASLFNICASKRYQIEKTMHTKTIKIASIALATLTLCATTTFAKPLANREICTPQNANMAKVSSFTTTCDWGKLKQGADTNPQITLNGKQTVHADCEFTGRDGVQLIVGKKHAEMQPVNNPGNKFNFTVKYAEDGNAGDDNQNLLIYLTASHPSADDKLVCTFITVAKPA